MKSLKIKYPFDPSLKHHIIIGFGLSVWIFLFLYFTEPLDVNELDAVQKLIYLPIYGLICGACYSVFIPFQVFLFKKEKQFWSLSSELLFLFTFTVGSSTLARFYYLYIVVADRKSTRLNSSHDQISYAVFCLKKKKVRIQDDRTA